MESDTMEGQTAHMSLSQVYNTFVWSVLIIEFLAAKE
jgi:hypothetical protein